MLYATTGPAWMRVDAPKGQRGMMGTHRVLFTPNKHVVHIEASIMCRRTALNGGSQTHTSVRKA